MTSFTGSGGSGSDRAHSSTFSAAVSFDSFQFDFGVGSGSSSSTRPLKDQKLNPNAASSNHLFSSSSKPASASLASSWNPSPASRPSWTHQASAAARPGLPNSSSSMVGDILGRSWSSNPATATSSHLGIPDKNPNLFSDLVGSTIGHGRTAQNVPLKSAPPKSSSFYMDGFKSSLPNTKNSLPNTNNPKPNSTGSFSFSQYGSKIGGPGIGSPMKPAVGVTSDSKTDPLGSLSGFGAKPSKNVPLSSEKSSGIGSAGSSFGAFQNVPIVQKSQQSNGNNDYSLGGFEKANRNDFGIPAFSPMQQQRAQAVAGADPLNMFSKSVSPGGALSEAPRIPEMNDWDIGVEFGGHESGETTTELEGLPPPPAGVTASSAKMKGLDNYKQGQFADAIKWLSWGCALLEKSGEVASLNEVLVCRASCYKEVGEYKKAIADCSKVLDHDSYNVSVLLQRALLYESSEKYRLGTEDLRTVLKIDPGNRLARSTIHRMNQFAD